MTILPKKRNPNPNNKENDKTDGPSTSTSASRNRGLISVIQDPGPSASTTSVAQRQSRCNRAIKRKSRDIIEHVPSKTSVPPSTNGSGSESERCNSEDEYEPLQVSNEEWEIRDREFKAVVETKGYVLKEMVEDGACLFRAVADQIYGDEEMHSQVRNSCMDYILNHRQMFSAFITEDLMRYVRRKRKNHVHGNHVEVHALSMMYRRKIEIYCYLENPTHIFDNGGDCRRDIDPIRLSYQRGSHYNSISDPYRAPVTDADLQVNSEAVAATTELTLIEQTMIEDKIAATDWEATNEAILEQATRESWALYVNDGQVRDPKAGCSSASSSASSAQTVSRITNSRSPQLRSRHLSSRLTPTPPPTHRISSHRICSTPPLQQISRSSSLPTSPRLQMMNGSKSLPSSPPHASPKSNYLALPSTSDTTESTDLEGMGVGDFGWNYGPDENVCIQMPPEIFGMNSWDEDAALVTKVLAESQKEYLDSLKAARQLSAAAAVVESVNDINAAGPSCTTTATTTR